VQRIAHAGRPFVFVPGNHDSDTLNRRLARAGAIDLTRRGQLRGDGTYGPKIVEAAGMRVAGYDDPLMRLSAERYRDHGGSASVQQQLDFFSWFQETVDHVDAIMVHSPQLAQLALDELRRSPPERPLIIFVGHTHRQGLERIGGATVVNGGTAGGGGAANIEDNSPIGIAAMTYRERPDFAPLAADLVTIDPGTGSATANRTRLDTPPPEPEEPDGERAEAVAGG
jgi:predicted phosphodiesterase